MTRWLVLAIVTCVVVGLVNLPSRARPDEGLDAQRKAMRRAAEAQLIAAERVVADVIERERAQEALAPEFVNHRATWFRRLREARIATADSIDKKASAANEHVDACLEWLRQARETNHPNPARIAAMEYELAEAEHRLAELGGAR